jgi:putative ABC transport system ATP-binding protein
VNAIEIEEISKTFAEVDGKPTRALDAVSLRLEGGTLTILVGSNGSGKTSLLRALSGELEPDSGTIRASFDERVEDWIGLTPRERSHWVAQIRQDPAAGSVGSLTVAENLRLATLRNGTHPIRRALSSQHHQWIEGLSLPQGLEHKLSMPSTTLSGGQRQLLAIEMAAARQAGLILMDEPTASLDPGNSFACMERAQTLADRGAIVIVVTHDLELGAAFGHRLLVMSQGRMVHDLSGSRRASLSTRDIFDLIAPDRHVVATD